MNLCGKATFGWILAAVATVASECSVLSQEAATPVAQKTLIATQELIPTDSAPTDLKRLMKEGKVDVVYDSEPEFVKASRGWADFNVQMQTTFEYDLMKTRKNGRWNVKITVTKLESKIELTHLIRLPSTFKSPDIWSSETLRHEFDHVAVSLDPRAMLLLKHLVEKLPVIERTLEPKEIPSNTVLNKLIDEEVVKRRQAVVELMRQNNILLDKVSIHGNRPVPDRIDFFGKLYAKEHIADQKFPFVDQVLDLMAKPEYRDAELPFLRRDPNDP